MSARREELLRLLSDLPEEQLSHVEAILRALADPPVFELAAGSDFATNEFALEFGAVLRGHHFVSAEPFSKDKFEYALERVLTTTGHEVARASRGNPGSDLDVDGERWSLKTQADAAIKRDEIHISKFMELGKGVWETEADLYGLRDRMFEHMEGYDRIFTLRCLSQAKHAPADAIEYELVEIPKELLLRAKHYPCVMRTKTTQHPKPGSCLVLDEEGVGLAYELYFDGGGERKLQIKHLAKSGCRTHATWRFPRAPS